MDAKENTPARVVEFELRLPRREEIRLPKVDWAPWKRLAGDVLLTSLGLGVLTVRAVRAAALAAHKAGRELSEQPESWAHGLADLADSKPAPASAGATQTLIPAEGDGIA